MIRTPQLIFIFLVFIVGIHAEELKLTLLNQIQERSVSVHDRVAPAVVEVQSLGKEIGTYNYGSGVVVSADGLILTSTTAVPPQTELIRVTFPSGRILDARKGKPASPGTRSIAPCGAPFLKKGPISFSGVGFGGRASPCCQNASSFDCESGILATNSPRTMQFSRISRRVRG